MFSWQEERNGSAFMSWWWEPSLGFSLLFSEFWCEVPKLLLWVPVIWHFATAVTFLCQRTQWNGFFFREQCRRTGMALINHLGQGECLHERDVTVLIFMSHSSNLRKLVQGSIPDVKWSTWSLGDVTLFQHSPDDHDCTVHLSVSVRKLQKLRVLRRNSSTYCWFR
jgi:hypothetical protein